MQEFEKFLGGGGEDDDCLFLSVLVPHIKKNEMELMLLNLLHISI